jgi:hypothetical protein
MALLLILLFFNYHLISFKNIFIFIKMNPQIRMYEIKREFVKDDKGNVIWRFVMPPSGDYVIEWSLLSQSNKGFRESSKIFLQFNDIKITAENNTINLKELRTKIRQIELPKTNIQNKLLALEQILIGTQIESPKTLDTALNNKKLKDKSETRIFTDFPKYSKEIIDDSIWMGGMTVVIMFDKRPPNMLYVRETFYPYCSLLSDKEHLESVKKSKGEKKEEKKKETKDLQNEIMKAMNLG